MSDIAVIGAGAFGTALAIALAEDGHKVDLIARNAAHVSQMSADRENRSRLPGHALPAGLYPSLTLGKSYRAVLLAVPTQALHARLSELGSSLPAAPFVTCNKGIDLTTGLGAAGIVRQVIPKARVAVLSGPGFAVDIAAGLPTAMTLACEDADLGAAMQDLLSTRALRLYLTRDVTGVQLCGALKNVIAIGAGISIGSGLGESARAALMSRGFAELTRFATAHGAKADTLSGLAGFGDLVLTCTSEKSRNMQFGMALGQGRSLAKGVTVEGASTARIVSKLAKTAEVSTPITDLVTAIIDGQVSVDQAKALLLARPLKKE